jgi:hypothetical protein
MAGRHRLFVERLTGAERTRRWRLRKRGLLAAVPRRPPPPEWMAEVPTLADLLPPGYVMPSLGVDLTGMGVDLSDMAAHFEEEAP